MRFGDILKYFLFIADILFMNKFLMIPIAMSFLACAPKEAVVPTPLQSKIGRFQMFQLGTFRRDQHLLDTETGRVWTNICAVGAKGSDCAYNYWVEEDFLDLNATPDKIASQISAAKKLGH